LAQELQNSINGIENSKYIKEVQGGKLMKLRVLGNLFAVFAIALFSYSAANAQVVDAVKDAADKTKDVTVDAAKKTVEVTKDAADKTKNATEKIAEGTKDTTVDAAKKTGKYTVRVVDNVKGQSYEGGRWLVVTTWDGTKWVSKRTWFATKKAASVTKDAVVGDDNKQKP